MGSLVCVMGESGSGKTTSLRNLDPKSTYIIDCDKKGLAWRGWRTQYGEGKKNYKVADDQEVVMKHMVSVNESAPHIKTLVIDTINGIMVADEARRRKERGYDKWSDLAWAVWDIVDYALKMRGDCDVVVLAHSQTERDESGFQFTRIKTSGKKLDKIALESKMRTVLHAKRVDGEYVFETRSDSSTAKDGMEGELPDAVENDMAAVLAALHEFDGASDAD